MNRITRYGVVIVLLFSTFCVNAASTSDTASFEALDISKETIGISYAYAISADGSVIVGNTKDMDGTQAFQFEDNDTNKLGFLEKDKIQQSKATAVSADGTTIINDCGIKMQTYRNYKF